MRYFPVVLFGLVAAVLHPCLVSGRRVPLITQSIVADRNTPASAIRTLDPTHRISIHIALTAPDTVQAEKALLDISDPDSPRYGRHWTTSQVARAFRPDPGHARAVTSWLNSSGICSSLPMRGHGGAFITCPSTVEEGGRLLGMSLVARGLGPRTEHLSVNILEEVSAAIDYIVLGRLDPVSDVTRRQAGERPVPRRPSRLLRTRAAAASNATAINCTEYMTPSCLQSLYNIPTTSSLSLQPSPNNTLGIYEISWQSWIPADLDAFFARFSPSLIGTRPTMLPIDGGYSQTNIQMTAFNIEADFDFEYALSLTASDPTGKENPVNIVGIQVGDEYQQGTLNNMLAAFDAYYCGALDQAYDSTDYPDNRTGGYNHSVDCGITTPPKVISISYAYPEANYPASYLRRQCDEFLKLGLMGVTVLTGSGDRGVASADANHPCLPAAGNGTGTAHRFSPNWPASCPWVTTVGGTQRPPNSGLQDETAYNTGSLLIGGATASSGGGFSNVFARPDYQKSAVSDYSCGEQSHLAPFRNASQFNASGRAYPDIAAFASAYLAQVDGSLHTVYGTSASAPVVAAMVSLINGERLAKGKASVGFMNPVLYAHPEVLRDIKTGANAGCGSQAAFPATAGWDAVTGLGTPDYGRLREVLLGLP